VFFSTALAIATPVAFRLMVKGLRQRWFWTSLVICVLLHLLFLKGSTNVIVFSSLGTAILLAFVEMCALLLVTAKVMASDPNGRATAEQFAATRRLTKRRSPR
jgi:hypothetical protein